MVKLLVDAVVEGYISFFSAEECCTCTPRCSRSIGGPTATLMTHSQCMGPGSGVRPGTGLETMHYYVHTGMGMGTDPLSPIVPVPFRVFVPFPLHVPVPVQCERAITGTVVCVIHVPENNVLV